MKTLLFRFHTQESNWIAFFPNGESRQYTNIISHGCTTRTVSKMEDGYKKFYLEVQYGILHEDADHNLYLTARP